MITGIYFFCMRSPEDQCESYHEHYNKFFVNKAKYNNILNLFKYLYKLHCP
jgi:hypothetical protein